MRKASDLTDNGWKGGLSYTSYYVYYDAILCSETWLTEFLKKSLLNLFKVNLKPTSHKRFLFLASQFASQIRSLVDKISPADLYTVVLLYSHHLTPCYCLHPFHLADQSLGHQHQTGV